MYLSVGRMPWGRFVSTYMKDYAPISEHHLQKNWLRPRIDVRAAPFFINPLQTGYDFWTTFYKTTNSVYGSSVYPQPPSYCYSPVPLPHSDIPVLETAGPALTDAGTQDVEVAGETRPVVGVGERGQLHYVHGGKVLEQQETKGEPQRMAEVLYEEGVVELSSYVCPACCKDRVKSGCREAGLQHLFHLPVISSPLTTVKDAENLDAGVFLRGLTACELGNSAFLQPFSRQCSCIHHSGTLSVVPVQSIANCEEPSRKPELTEYQASYTAEWARPKIQQNTFFYIYRPHHQICCHLP